MSQAFNDLDRIKRFNHMNLLPVPLKMNKLKGKLKLGDSLPPHHAAKFQKLSKLKFGNEKLHKAMKKFEKQEKIREPSTSQARSNY